MTEIKLLLLPPHDDGVKQCEIDEQNHGGNPGAHGDAGADSKNGAAEIERIPCVGVRAGDREDFLLVKISSGKGAQPQANRSRERASQNAARRGAGKKQNDNYERIAKADAPTREERSDGAHARASTLRRTASKTASTSSSSMEGSA